MTCVIFNYQEVWLSGSCPALSDDIESGMYMYMYLHVYVCMYVCMYSMYV